MNGAENRGHTVQISMRKEMTVNGVTDVESFDETGALFQTTTGELTVEGRDLRVGVLDIERGLVTMTGQIDAVFYSDSEPSGKRRFFNKGRSKGK